VRGDGQGPAFVGGCDKAEQELGAGVVQRSEAHFIDYEQVVAQQGVDGLADRVVGQSPVEGLDQVGRGEVTDSVSGVRCGVAKGYQGVRLARAGRPDQSQILFRTNPFQRCQVGERGCRDTRGGEVELLDGLDDWERCSL